ncbi:MAG TPA: type II toxin-antitoxin system RelE/ParE family toxin [Candidatus Kapabacteria bacterium]|nr:type II toxin-antitoxin system RelE/ParE family toxin [Candidatus Kapabacteria bacterium]
MVHGFVKKTQKIPGKELTIAKKRMKSTYMCSLVTFIYSPCPPQQ